MKSWSLFIITIGTLFIVIYPKTKMSINLIMGLTFVVIGTILLIIRSRRK